MISTNEIIVANDPSQEVPVVGPATDAELRATPLPVSGPLTDTQLRAAAVPVSVSGSVSVSNFPATQPVSGPLTDTQLRATPVPISGSVSTTPVVSSSATSTPVALTANTNGTLLSANASRQKIVIFAPKATLYIKLGATASATSFAYIVVAANTTLEVTGWVGRVDALSTVNQTVNVTELI